MNELALIFEKLNIDTQAVVEAASTKWNFHRYHPGLVGGHCIGVDPYYLTYRAQQLGYKPEIILAGRHLNDSMARLLAERVIAVLPKPKGAKALVLGLTFKENINDFRNSKSKDVIKTLQKAGLEVMAMDPMAQDGELEKLFGIKNSTWEEVNNLDAVVYIVPHKKFADISLAKLKGKCGSNPVLFDLRRVYSRLEAEKLGFKYLTL